ncbi:MAG: hypothetical protein L0Y35_05440 [Flammeovirgaceae bacterium]|nr:hypothetical protein [Flammeovirgaceae bacterium]
MDSFFTTWDRYMYYGFFGSLVIAALILLYHEFRLFQIKDYKEKYDYVNLHEIRYFWYAVIAVIASGFFFANTVASGRIANVAGGAMLWFWVRLFICICFATIAYFVFDSLVRIMYPKYVEKRLVKLRDKPRLSPAGNAMRKLSEAEEDAYLTAEQIAEEANGPHSVDYDVWLDEKTGFKKIEKYYPYQHAEECPDCGYVTMKIDKEEVEKMPSSSEEGLLLKHYRCHYCNHREVKEARIPRIPVKVA